MMYILYSIVDGEVMSPKVYSDYEIAATEANKWNDVQVLKIEEPITKEEFEKGYAVRSKMTLEKLHELGGHAEPCDCDYSGCKEWKMMFSIPKNGEDDDVHSL